MGFVDAFNTGANIGKDLAYHFTGMAAEDIRLNREAKRQELDFNNQKMQIMQQQAQREQENYDKQIMYEKAQGNLALTKNVIANPELYMDDWLQSLNQFNNEYNYFPGVRLAKYDASMIDPQKEKDIIVAYNSLFGTVKDSNVAGYNDSLASIRSRLAMRIDDNDGSITPILADDLFYQLGGNAGYAYLIKKIQDDQYKAQLENDVKQSQIAKNEQSIVDSQVKNAKTLDDMDRNQRSEDRAVAMSNQIANNGIEDPNRTKSYTTKDGLFTGQTYQTEKNEAPSNSFTNSLYMERYEKLRRASQMTPNEFVNNITEMRVIANNEKIKDVDTHLQHIAAEQIKSYLNTGDISGAIEFSSKARAALGLSYKDSDIEQVNKLSKLDMIKGLMKSDKFGSTYGPLDAVARFLEATTGIGVDEKEFEIFIKGNLLFSDLMYAKMGKRPTKHGMSVLPELKGWQTGGVAKVKLNAMIDEAKSEINAYAKFADPMTKEFIDYYNKILDGTEKQANEIQDLANLYNIEKEGGILGFGGKDKNNIIVKQGDIKPYLGNRTVVHFTPERIIDGESKPITIYLKSSPNEPLYLSVDDFNQLTQNRYITETKDLR